MPDRITTGDGLAKLNYPFL